MSAAPGKARASERRIDVGGHRLFAAERGAGPAVLLLHGFTGDTTTLAELAEALGARHRVVCVDLPGHGRSDAPAGLDAYRLPACAAQLVRVLDALGIGRAHVLGYSMGGRVALGLAVWHPARVASLQLVGASAGLAAAAARAERIRADARLAEALERDGIEAFVERWMALPLFASQRPRRGEAFWAAARRQRLGNRPEALARSLRACGSGAQPPLHARLGGLSMPVALYAGEEDAKFLAIARDLAARIPGARVGVIPGAGHACHLENPAAFTRAALAFLSPSQRAAAQPAPARAAVETHP